MMTEERRELLSKEGKELKADIVEKINDFSKKHNVVVKVQSSGGSPRLKIQYNQDDLNDPNEYCTDLIIN